MFLVWLLNRPSHLEALQWDQWDLRKNPVQSNKTSHKTKQFIIFLKGMLCKAVCVRGDGFAIKCFCIQCSRQSMLLTSTFSWLWEKTVEIWVWPGIFRGDLMYCKISKYSKYTMYIHYMHPWEFPSTTRVQYIYIYIHILDTHLVFPTSKMEMDTPFASCQVPSGRGKRSEAWALLSVKEPCPQLQPSGIQWDQFIHFRSIWHFLWSQWTMNFPLKNFDPKSLM